MPRLLIVPQTATLMGMSLRATYRAIEADAIPHFRIGRRITILTAKLLEQLGLPLSNASWSFHTALSVLSHHVHDSVAHDP